MIKLVEVYERKERWFILDELVIDTVVSVERVDREERSWGDFEVFFTVVGVEGFTFQVILERNSETGKAENNTGIYARPDEGKRWYVYRLHADEPATERLNAAITVHKKVRLRLI